MANKKKKQRKDPAICRDCEASSTQRAGRFIEAGVMLIVLAALYNIGKSLEIFSFSASTEEVVGLGTVFLIGLTASTTSCLAMVGGLLLSVSASWSKAHPSSTHWEKFEPQLHFNIGRIVGYFFFGGLAGLLGKSLLLSVHGTGILKILIALLMIVLGLNILGILPRKYCRIPLPKFLAARIRTMSASESVLSPFFLGALTFFVPCGFTQSMQLLALSSGSFAAGAAIMVVFAIGTLPALLGLSAMGSFSEGRLGKLFLTFAGCVSLLLGFSGLQSGFLLTGIDLELPIFSASAVANEDPNVTIDKNGQQIISVGVTDRGYSAPSFTIVAGKPTWIYASAPEPVAGCISSFVIPDFGISKLIRKGDNWIGPITPAKDFAFMCSMGMFKADVRVRS